ncbi:MAG: hypothetical protein AB8B55_14485 [Mariniblastus sp.]
MPQKDKFKPIIKSAESAISVRSDSVSGFTCLFDDSYLVELNQMDFDPIGLLQNNGSEEQLEVLSTWAGDGRWMAIESLPCILDDDAVPGLDIVILSSDLLHLLEKAKKEGPVKDAWFDPVTQYLDIPSGILRVVYEDDFFSNDYDQNKNLKLIESPEDELVRHREFSDSASYLVSCTPGFYRAYVFTRFQDETSEYEPDEGSPDVVVYLEPTEKPLSFSNSCPLIPNHPVTQDLDAIRRTAQKISREKGWD